MNTYNSTAVYAKLIYKDTNYRMIYTFIHLHKIFTLYPTVSTKTLILPFFLNNEKFDKQIVCLEQLN